MWRGRVKLPACCRRRITAGRARTRGGARSSRHRRRRTTRWWMRSSESASGPECPFRSLGIRSRGGKASAGTAAFMLRRLPSPTGQDGELCADRSGRNERADQVTEPRQRRGRRPIRELIARELLFSGQPMSATQIAKAIEYLPDRTQAALERMEHAGQVVRNEGVAGRSASRPLLKPTGTRQARATVSSMPHSTSSAAQQQLLALTNSLNKCAGEEGKGRVHPPLPPSGKLATAAHMLL